VALSAQPKVAIEFDAGVWTDASADSTHATWDRGRSTELDQFQGGSGSVTLKNADRKYDPEYAAGPYYGKLLPRKRIRIGFAYNGTTYWKFYGYIKGWPQAYAGPKMSFVTVTATDAFKVFAGGRLPSAWAQKVKSMAPLSWWRLGESAGTSMVDSSGNGHNGIYEGGATFNSRSGMVFGDSDGAISFQNNADGRVNFVNHPTAKVSAFPMSLVFGFNSSATPTTPHAFGQTIFWQKPNIEGAGRIDLSHTGSAGSGGIGITDDGLLLAIDDAAGNSRKWTTNVAVADGEDHLIIVDIVDPDTVVIFVDGNSVSTSVYSSTGSTPAMPASDYQQIGAGLTGAAVIDEMAVFDRVVDTTEVAALYAAFSAPWEGDTPKQRIDRVLDYLGWPIGDRDLDTGSASLAAAQLETDALSHLQAVELTEGGRFFIDRTGRATLVGRQNFWTEAAYLTANATFGDAGTELRYKANDGDLFGYDDEKIVNDARVSTSGGSVQVSTDAASADLATGYGLMTREESSLEQDPGLAKARADYLVFKYKDPALRMPSVTITPERSAAALYPVVGVNDLGYRYTFKRRPQNVGSAIAKEFHVESESGDMTPDTLTITWELSPAEPMFWVLGTSVLGTDTRPGY
jgi:hypothetical protein